MLHYAILGTNWLSQRYRHAIGAVGSRLTAVCSRSLERAREFGGEEVLIYDNLDRLLENPEIDAVYLCLPNCLHAETAIRCLRAGKHVLCEKPATVSSAELEAVLQAAEESGRVFAEAVMNFYSPVMDWLREELAVNPVASVRLDYSQRSSKLDYIRAGGMASSFDRSLYGGVLSDLGVYPLHFAVNLFGTPRSITAAARFLGAVDGTDVLTLRYDGFDAVITASKCCHSMLGSEILCDRATYTLKNVSVVLGVEKHTMEETTPVDCGIPCDHWPITNPSMLDGVQERVLRTFERWVQGEDLARCKLLQQESLTVQRLMEEAHRQMGY